MDGFMIGLAVESSLMLGAAFVIWYFKSVEKRLQQYIPITARCIGCQKSYTRHKELFGGYNTTVQYCYNGAVYENTLSYYTSKLDEGESVDCLVNPSKPDSIYPVTAHKINTRIIKFAWLICIISVMMPVTALMISLAII